MDRAKVQQLLSAGFITILLMNNPAFAEEFKPVNVTLMPFKYVAVKGDVQKFRALNWMNDGYSYGLKELSYDQSFKNGLGVALEGHSIPNENDNAVDLNVSKSGLGYLKTDYSSFRKYYDSTGGTYYPFTTYRTVTLQDDLKMDMEHFLIEIGTPVENESGVSASFDRHTKDGRKTRLAWTAIKEGAITKDHGPSWQDVDEVTDTVSLKANTEMVGVKLSGQQDFEFFHADVNREEKNLTNAGGLSADNKFRRQVQRPEADLFTTFLRGEKWMLNDKSYLSLNYRYSNMDNSETETLTEYKADGTLFNYTSPKNRPNASANNRYDAHTLISNFMSNITDSLNFITKIKAENITKRATSTYPGDTNANAVPNGIINTTEVSNVEDYIHNFGENFSLRYNGIKHTSLYTDLELQQVKNKLIEERDSIAGESAAEAGEQFMRNTMTDTNKAIVTTGARIVPNKYFNVTTQLRHKKEVNDFDDKEESVYASGAKSAFFDEMRLYSDDASVRLAVKPIKRIEIVGRYQLGNNKYLTRGEAQLEQKSRTLSNTFTYDLNLQPVDPLFLTLSYSKTLNKTTTSANASSAVIIPGFLSDVDNWLFSSSYQVTQKLNFNNSFLYSYADNYNDFTSSGLPLAASFKQYDYTTGLQWQVKEDISLAPHYSYLTYQANQDYETGSSYNAHVVWLDVNIKW